MMAASTFSAEDLLCPQCTGIYCVPVLLPCGHNICKVCLEKFWEWKGCRKCPVCHAVSVPTRPPVNLELKIVADQYQGATPGGSQELCRLHDEMLTIFCQNDNEPICLSCQTSKQHKIHNCCPVEEAAQQKKTEISSKLETLRKKLRTLMKTREHWKETKNYIQIQTDQTQKAIKEEFEKLHRFLLEEEDARVKVLRREEEVKMQVMCEKLAQMESQIKSLSSIVCDAMVALRAKDLPFLQDYKQTSRRIKCNIGEPECIRDILINSAKHLGLLKFRIWKEMAKSIKYAPVTLDPNTAQSNLKLSEELSCVQYDSKQLLPDNPERWSSRVSLLGASGFTSGKHRWTVDIGRGKDWHIGVVRESVKRKNAVFLNPSEGFWVVGLSNGDSLWAETAARTKLPLKQQLQKVTVVLDYDKGKVTFINADDATQMYTFRDRFTEKIFPFFSPGMYEEGRLSCPLRICPLHIKVDVV